MVVFPAPDRPKSAVIPGPVENDASSANAPMRKRASNSSIAAGSADVRAPQQELGGHQRDQRQHDGEDAEAQGLRVAAGHLREGVDRERQRLGLSRNIGHERDGGTEFA